MRQDLAPRSWGPAYIIMLFFSSVVILYLCSFLVYFFFCFFFFFFFFLVNLIFFLFFFYFFLFFSFLFFFFFFFFFIFIFLQVKTALNCISKNRRARCFQPASKHSAYIERKSTVYLMSPLNKSAGARLGYISQQPKPSPCRRLQTSARRPVVRPAVRVFRQAHAQTR